MLSEAGKILSAMTVTHCFDPFILLLVPFSTVPFLAQLFPNGKAFLCHFLLGIVKDFWKVLPNFPHSFWFQEHLEHEDSLC